MLAAIDDILFWHLAFLTHPSTFACKYPLDCLLVAADSLKAVSCAQNVGFAAQFVFALPQFLAYLQRGIGFWGKGHYLD